MVPMQFEQQLQTQKSPAANFTAQPYQSTPPQYNRVQPPSYAPSGKRATIFQSHFDRVKN